MIMAIMYTSLRWSRNIANQFVSRTLKARDATELVTKEFVRERELRLCTALISEDFREAEADEQVLEKSRVNLTGE